MNKFETNKFFENIHASCVCINGRGLLLLGASGSGKSDLALRLIENKKAVLVADDRVDLSITKGKLYASPPEILKGLLEVRGVGIMTIPFCSQTEVCLAIKLMPDFKTVERLPEEEFFVFKDTKIPQLSLYPFESSAPDKIVIKLKALLD